MVQLGELTPPPQQPSDPEHLDGPVLAQVFLLRQAQALLNDVARELPTGALSPAKRAALIDVLEYLACMLRQDQDPLAKETNRC